MTDASVPPAGEPQPAPDWPGPNVAEPVPAPEPPLPPLPPSASNLPIVLPGNLTMGDAVTAIEGVVGVKPGSATTEFWLTIILTVGNTAAAVFLLVTNRIDQGAATAMIGGSGGLTAIYTLARTWLKVNAVQPPTVIPPGSPGV